MMKEFYTKDLLVNNNYTIGNYTYGLPKVYDWDDGTKLTIGKYCSIAENVTILLGGNHRADWVTTYPFPAIADFPDAKEISGHPASKGDVVIGNDVWIAYGCIILSGVTISDGAIIAAGAVVTKDVSAYSIVAGNPAREVKKRFDQKQIDRLLEISWWNWSEQKVKENFKSLCNEDITLFIKDNC